MHNSTPELWLVLNSLGCRVEVEESQKQESGRHASAAVREFVFALPFTASVEWVNFFVFLAGNQGAPPERNQERSFVAVPWRPAYMRPLQFFCGGESQRPNAASFVSVLSGDDACYQICSLIHSKEMDANMKSVTNECDFDWNTSSATPQQRSSTCTCPQVPSVDSCGDQRLPSVIQMGLFQNIPLFWAVSVLVSFLLFAFLVKKRGRQSKATPYHGVALPCTTAALERKRNFISRCGNAYGYAKCPSGHIDMWRPMELPNLIPPVGTNHISDNNNEHEVYLDYAGAALPTRTQLERIIESSQNILANPHSTGPAASRTLLLMEQAKKLVMDHFQCQPGHFAGLTSPPESCTPMDCHPGYDVVWTSGATESLRIVSERFPWMTCDERCGRRSTLVYSQNSHTSVVGMRGLALAKGATFQCHSLSDICSADIRTIGGWTSCLADTQCNCCRESSVRNLLVFPLQCNFGGDKANVTNVIQKFRKVTSNEGPQWYTMIDLAKAASTEPINLKYLDPDFACVSFYKLFGEPTGLGALFVKRTAVNILTGEAENYKLDRYFGGGSVDAVLPRVNFAVGRTSPSLLASLSNGSVHFRGISSLCHGFDELDRVGGMESVRAHTAELAAELARRLRELQHGNGRPAVVIYGAWANVQDIGLEDALLPGPTIAFNVLRDDGSFVGYNEVSKLAGLNRPPLQLRTGCFCNPGACQEALQLGDDEVQSNYLSSNHVCGDHIDIINDKPTGAIRASFGKDSTWEDLDALVTFITKHFLNEATHGTTMTLPSTVSQVQLSELYIFPIKSCSAQRVSRWMLRRESGRLAFDREFALVDSSGTAMRLQTYPRMSQLVPSVDLATMTLTVRAPSCPDLVILLDDKCPRMNVEDSIVKVCGNICGGKLWGDLASSDWFSSFLGVQCWLARHCGNGYEVAASRGGVAFANEAPLLLLSQHSVEILNEVLVSQGQKHVNSQRFRPNLVVRSTAASGTVSAASGDGLKHSNPEDRWTKLYLNGKNLELNVIGQCARCSMVDIDPATGAKQKTMRALADYRRRNGQITFGVFLRTEIQDQDKETVWLEEGDTLKCI